MDSWKHLRKTGFITWQCVSLTVSDHTKCADGAAEALDPLDSGFFSSGLRFAAGGRAPS
jgi:hypothetical protein